MIYSSSRKKKMISSPNDFAPIWIPFMIHNFSSNLWQITKEYQNICLATLKFNGKTCREYAFHWKLNLDTIWRKMYLTENYFFSR